jgi:hypothetical protein
MARRARYTGTHPIGTTRATWSSLAWAGLAWFGGAALVAVLMGLDWTSL